MTIPRCPLAVAVHRGGPVVLCSDGSVWWYCPELGEWSDYPPIPGTEADAGRATLNPPAAPPAKCRCTYEVGSGAEIDRSRCTIHARPTGEAA